MKAEMRDHGWGSIVETARKTTNTVTLTAFTEDALASGGAVIALVGIWLSQNTGDPIYDAVASFIIGLLLMAFALMLSWQNKRLLLGESFPDDEETKLRTGLEESDRVVDVIEFQDGMSTGEIEAHITSMAKELKSINPDVKAVYIERPE
jgi:divalent metal cation (Fe/Co/Zn/Cd) transporter